MQIPPFDSLGKYGFCSHERTHSIMQTQTLTQKLQTGGLGLNLKGHFVCFPRVTMLVQTEIKVFNSHIHYYHNSNPRS